MSVGDEFGRRVSDDELCAEVRQAVEGGDEDALRRLGFGGFGGYVQRLSEIMSDSVTDGLDLSAGDFGAIMGEVASPARYAHHLVNEAGTAIQSAKDKPLGIHIKPAEPDFDDDALCGTVGKAASMDNPERAVETLADGLSYAVKKAGNDFIKANAEQRSRAGFEVKVKRSGSTKCCPWCAARIGSWAIANAPDGVFGCHANCSCTVEYTSSTGAKTSARGANLHRYGAGAFAEVEYQPPHVMSREEAREKGGFDEPKRLTGSNIPNYAKTLDLFNDNDLRKGDYTQAEIVKEMSKSAIGREILSLIPELGERIKLTYGNNPNLRGQELGGQIEIYVNQCKNVTWVARTIIHEVTHLRYGIGGSQWAECVCIAQELKHSRNRDNLTIAEKRLIINAVKSDSDYSKLNWRKGGFIHGKRKSH